MTNLFELGRQLYDASLESLASATAEYRKCGEDTGVALLVTPLGGQRRSEDGENFSLEYDFTDFAIRMDTPVSPATGDTTFELWLGRDPLYGDRIHFANDIYIVGDDQGNPAFDWTSIYKTSIRIHSVYHGEVPSA